MSSRSEDPAVEAERRAATLLTAVVRGTAAVTLPALAVVALIQPELWRRALAAAVLLAVWGSLALLISRFGRARLGSIVFIAGILLQVTLFALPAGGIRSPGVSSFFIFALMAWLLLGPGAGAAVAVLCALIGLVLAVAEMRGVLPAQTTIYGPLVLWIIYSFYIAILVQLLRLVIRKVTEAQQRESAERADRMTVELDRERVVLDLRERVKELRLLHSAARLLRSDRRFAPDLLAQLVAQFPAAWRHPELCEARIAYLDLETTTPGWGQSRWRQAQPFRTSAGEGLIEVIYREPGPGGEEDPFLPEEAALLGSLAELLVAYFEHDFVERRQRELENQLRQSQKMQAIGSLASGVAHDFNHVLSAILGNTENALADAGSDSAVRPALQEIEVACHRARDLVGRLIRFGRPSPVDRRPLPTAGLVEDAIRLLRAGIPKSIEIRSRVSFDVPPILGDATQVHQILLNLGTNAGHAMATTGGTLSIDVDGCDLPEDAASGVLDLRSGPWVRIRVSDTGMGMSREVRERLFEPYFSTKGDAGSGLGLSVVHGIVRDHDGAIAVESEPGKGTTFRVWLPAASDGKAETAEEIHIAKPGNGEHILLVDDEAVLAFAISKIVRRLGYRCTPFLDPAQALEAFRADPGGWDLLLTDLAMPTMTGEDLAASVHAIRRELPIVLASGHLSGTGPDPDRGIVARLPKPATTAEIARALDAALSRAPSTAEVAP